MEIKKIEQDVLNTEKNHQHASRIKWIPHQEHDHFQNRVGDRDRVEEREYESQFRRGKTTSQEDIQSDTRSSIWSDFIVNGPNTSNTHLQSSNENKLNFSLKDLDVESFDPIDFLNKSFSDKMPTASDFNLFNILSKNTMEDLKFNIELQHVKNFDPQEWHMNVQLVSKVRALQKELESMIVDYKKVTESLQMLIDLKDNLHIGISYVNKFHLLMHSVNNILQSIQFSEKKNQLDLLSVGNLCCSALSLGEQFNIHIMPCGSEKETLESGRVPPMENSQKTELVNKLCNIRDFIIRQMESDLKWRRTEGDLSNLRWITNVEQLEQYRPGLRSLVMKSIRKATITIYKQCFKDVKDQDERLSSIPNRFRWLKQYLLKFQKEHGSYIPDTWCLPQEITQDFCIHFRKFIDSTLKLKADCNVSTLYKVLQHTIAFERSMDEKFTYLKERKKMSKRNINQNEKTYTFTGTISPIFSSYMQTAYVSHEETNVNQVVSQVMNKSLTEETELLGGIESNVAQDIFIVIEQSCNNCIAFNRSNILFGLVQNVWRVHLSKYASFLMESLQKTTIRTSKTREVARKIFSLNYFKDSTGTQNEFRLMTPLKEIQLNRICKVLALAEHCHSEIGALESLVQDLIDEEYKEQVSFSDERALYLKAVKNGCDIITNHLFASIESSMESMVGLDWKKPSCRQENAYCLTIEEQLEESIHSLSNNLIESHMKIICKNFVIRFVSDFQSNLLKVKQFTRRGAQQLTLDTKYLKESFRKVLVPKNIDKDDMRYLQKTISSFFNRFESLLRVLTVESHQILQAYKREIGVGNRSTEEFHQLIEIRSDISKQEKEILLRIVFNSSTNENEE